MIDASHDPELASWVASANVADHDFPIQNLPFGVAELPNGEHHICTAIGDSALDLHQVSLMKREQRKNTTFGFQGVEFTNGANVNQIGGIMDILPTHFTS